MNAHHPLSRLRHQVSGAIARGEATPIVGKPAPAIRPMPDIARDGLWHDANGYPIMALWLACFMQAYEATHLQG